MGKKSKSKGSKSSDAFKVAKGKAQKAKNKSKNKNHHKSNIKVDSESMEDVVKLMKPASQKPANSIQQKQIDFKEPVKMVDVNEAADKLAETIMSS